MSLDVSVVKPYKRISLASVERVQPATIYWRYISKETEKFKFIKDVNESIWKLFSFKNYFDTCDNLFSSPKPSIGRGTTDPGYWVYNLNYPFEGIRFVFVLEIIQVSDSIPWVCCASGHIFLHIPTNFKH